MVSLYSKNSKTRNLALNFRRRKTIVRHGHFAVCYVLYASAQQSNTRPNDAGLR